MPELLSSFLCKTKLNLVAGNVKNDVFAPEPVDAKEAKINSTTNVLEATDAHFVRVINIYGYEVTTRGDKLLSANHNGKVGWVTVARDGPILPVVVELCSLDLSVERGDDIRVNVGDCAGAIKVDIHLSRGNIDVGRANAESRSVETVCRPVFFKEIVNPCNRAGVFLGVDEAKVEDGSSYLCSNSKDFLGKLRLDVVYKRVLRVRLDGVERFVTKAYHAIPTLGVQLVLRDCYRCSNGLFSCKTADRDYSIQLVLLMLHHNFE